MSQLEASEKFTQYRKLVSVPADFLEILEYAKLKKTELVSRTTKVGTQTFLTIDVKLPRFKEDSLYEDDDIRFLVPRGLCYVFCDGTYVHTLCGHSKFGNSGDFNQTHINYNDLVKVYRSKENGECTHWSAFEHDGQIYEIYGSKNVHFVVRTDHFAEDISSYTEDRYAYATKMARLIDRIYGNSKQYVIPYLVSSKNTLCGEACFTDSQHLVKYETSQMYWFAVTGKRCDKMESITKISPLDIDCFVESMSLTKVLNMIVCTNKDEREIAETYFETKDNSEGAVVSCIDSKGNTVYVYKHKNFDYIFKRALREQMKKYASSQRIMKRFSELHIVHPNYEQMVDWAFKFNAWFRQASFSEEEKSKFFDQWVTNKNKFDALTEDEKVSFLQMHQEYEKSKRTLEVIIFVAMPGSGKTFMARVIKQILEANGKKVGHLEQDMFFHKGPKQAGKWYEKAIEDMIKDESLDYLILTKSNHNHQVRNKTYDTLGKCARNINRTYVVMSANDGDMKKTGNLCVDRIMKRGLAHTSLFGMPEEKIREIVFGVFVKQWEPLNESELSSNVISLEIDEDISKEDVVNSFCLQSNVLDIGDFKVSEETVKSIFSRISLEDLAQAQKNAKTLKK